MSEMGSTSPARGDAAAEIVGSLRQVHVIAALAEGAGGFEAGRAGADDEHGIA